MNARDEFPLHSKDSSDGGVVFIFRTYDAMCDRIDTLTQRVAGLEAQTTEVGMGWCVIHGRTRSLFAHSPGCGRWAEGQSVEPCEIVPLLIRAPREEGKQQ